MYIRKYQKNGKTHYLFKLYGGIDPATGKQIHITRRGFNSLKEAELEYYRLQLQIDNDGYKKSERYTFQEVYDLWIQQYKNTVKESTYNKTLTLFRCHILPVFSKKYMDSIKVTHCQDALNKWFKDLKNYRSVNSYTSLVFKHAMKLGIIEKNPTQLVTMPVRKEKGGEEDALENYYSKSELNSFLDSLKDSIKWFTFFRFLAYSGTRKGEALAITWNDVNFKDETVTINKTVALGIGNKIIIQSPKTKQSRRVIPIDPATMEILKKWKAHQAELMLKFGFNTLKPDQLVFTNLKNTYINPQKIGQVLNKYCEAAGLKRITPHGFRHTHCSILFELGASIKEVQDRLGHSDIQTTMNIYTHVTEKKKEETALKFAQFMEQI